MGSPDTRSNSLPSIHFNSSENDPDYQSYLEENGHYDEDEEVATEAEILEEVEAQDRLDVFVQFANPRTLNGNPVKIKIKKDGAMLTTKVGVYTWEQLHKEFGQGVFKVTIHDGFTGKYIKSQTEHLGVHLDNANEQKTNMNQQPYVDQGLSGRDLLAMFKEQGKEQDRRDEKRSDANKQFLATLLTAATGFATAYFSSGAGKKDDGDNNMMLELFKMNQSNQKDMNERLEKVVDKMTEQFTAKDTGLSEIKVFEMVREAEDRGWSKAATISDLVDEKALEKAAVMGAKDDSSLTDKLITNLLPAFGQMYQSQLNKPQAIQAPPRGELSHDPQARAKQIAAQKEVQRKRAKVGGGGKPSRGANRQIIINDIPLPPKKTDVNTTEAVENWDDAEIVANDFENEGVETSSQVETNSQSSIITKGEDEQFNTEQLIFARKKYLEALLPVVVDCLINGIPEDQGADLVIKQITEMGGEPEAITTLFTANDLVQLAKENGLPVEAHKWLEGFYANIQSKTGTRSRESAQAN